MKPKTKKILLISLAALTLGSLLISFLSPSNPKLISSTPSNSGNLSDPNLPITLQFDRQVDLVDFSFTITPSETINSANLDSNTIQINFGKSLLINTKYLISINYKSRPLTQLSFTTNAPPGIQYDARFNQNIQSELDTQYPLIAKTPYNTSSYRVVYGGPMTLEIIIKETGVSPEIAIKEIRAWVTSEGGDATTHKYVVASPSPAPTN